MKPAKRKSQKRLILEWLQRGNLITPRLADDKFGCMRLGARIFELREDGHKIPSKLITVASGKRVSLYWMEADDAK